MPQRPLVIRIAQLLVLLVSPALIVTCTNHDAKAGVPISGSSVRIDTTVGHAPSGVRIKVEVLNASNNRGAARRATLLLRDRGYDVVAMGTTQTKQSATVVLDRSHHPEWAQLIAKVIGAKAAERPDTSRYLDATVVLGSEWTPPPMPFYP
jgi:aspartokinase